MPGPNGRGNDSRTRNGNTPIEYCRRSCSCEFKHGDGCDDQAGRTEQPQPTPQLLDHESSSQPTNDVRDRYRDGSVRGNRKQPEQHKQQFGRRNHYKQQQQQRVELWSNRDAASFGEQQLIQPSEFTSTLSPWWRTGPNNSGGRGKEWFAFIGNSHGTLAPTSNNETKRDKRCRPVRPPTYPHHSSVQQ